MISFETEVDTPWPAAPDWHELATRAAEALAPFAPGLTSPRISVSLLFTSDAEVRALNREWRGKDKPTNVLSFPMLSRAELTSLSLDGPPVLLGDIALAYETCAREASEKGILLDHHAAHLVIHGLLHLAGHDHEASADEATAMESLETKALALLGIADPYCSAQTD